MESEFVTYEIALRMKELGFDNIPCLAIYYNVPVMDDYECFDFTSHLSYTHYETQYYANKGFKDSILAPTWQSAIQWFMKEHKLFGKVDISIFDEEPRYVYTVQNYDVTHNMWIEVVEDYGGYEEYSEASKNLVMKLCEIVENRNKDGK